MKKKKRQSTASLLRQAHTELLTVLQQIDRRAPRQSRSPLLCRWCETLRGRISRADGHVLHVLNREAGNQ